MKKMISVFVTILFLSVISCKTEKKEAAQITQMKDVMAIHDEVMPKMGAIGKLVAELNAKADTTDVGKQYDSAKKDLQAAHKSMMDWMHGFGDRFDSDEILNGKELSPEKQQWLDEEEAKIKAVREQCYASIEKAEKLLGK